MKCDVIYCKTLHTRLGHFYNIVDVVNTQIGLDWAHVELCNTSIRRKCRREWCLPLGTEKLPRGTVLELCGRGEGGCHLHSRSSRSMKTGVSRSTNTGAQLLTTLTLTPAYPYPIL